MDAQDQKQKGLPGVESVESVNKIKDWLSAYMGIPGLAVGITMKQLAQDVLLASQYKNAASGLSKLNSGSKIAGTTTGIASLAMAGYLARDKYNNGTFNTSTALDLGVSAVLVLGGIFAGTAAAPFVIAGGLVYGIERIAAGDQIYAFIDSKLDTKSLCYDK